MSHTESISKTYDTIGTVQYRLTFSTTDGRFNVNRSYKSEQGAHLALARFKKQAGL